MRAPVLLLCLSLAVACQKEQPKQAGGAAAPGGAAAKAPGPKPADCNSDMSKPVTTDWTMRAECSPYTLPGDLNVDGWSLTIEPGVEVKVPNGANVYVGYGKPSQLTARGTAEKPIRFVSAARQEAGAWRQVVLYGHATGSTLENVVIENGGGGDRPALQLGCGDTTVKNVAIKGAKGKALLVESDDPQKELSGLDLTGSAGPLAAEVTFAAASAMAGPVKVSDPAVIGLRSEVKRDVTLRALGVPWRVLGEVHVHGESGSVATLTLEPGTTVQLADSALFHFGYEAGRPGMFSAVGSQEKPIKLTHVGEGKWRGFVFYANANPPDAAFVTFEHGAKKDGALIRYEGAIAGLGRWSHNTFAHVPGTVFQAAPEVKGGWAAFDANTFEDTGDVVIDVPVERAGGIATNNKFPASGRVKLSGDCGVDATLQAIGVPFRRQGNLTIAGGEASATLTLQPGVTLELGDGTRIYAGHSKAGKLTAVGTAEQPIVLKAIESRWGGIEVSDKGTLTLENAKLEGVSDDRPAVRASASADGNVKDVAMSGKAGVTNCSKKLKASGVKMTGGGKPESREGC